MNETVDILGVKISKVTMDETVSTALAWLDEDGIHSIFTPNAEIIMAANRDSGLKCILNNADLLIADGMGVVLGSRILKRNVPEKVSGIDLVRNLFKACSKRRIRFYIFGGKPGVAEMAKDNILKQYPGVEIAGCNNGYFSKEEEDGIIEKINASGADVLLVAFGVPLQENWIHRCMNRLKVKICIGVGGSVDVFAGTVKPVPEVMRRNGLEWLHRLYQEPSRYKRMLDLPRFVIRVVAERIRKH